MTASQQHFPPQARLKKPAEFKKVFANPYKSADSYFTMLAMPNGLGYPRLGLAIAKKVIKQAVGRNVIKRAARESFRLHQDILGGLDIVVLARQPIMSATPELIRKSLETHWLKLKSKCGTC